MRNNINQYLWQNNFFIISVQAREQRVITINSAHHYIHYSKLYFFLITQTRFLRQSSQAQLNQYKSHEFENRIIISRMTDLLAQIQIIKRYQNSYYISYANKTTEL